MPDTGAPWNIPYVAPSDLVRDYPSDSEDLADAIAAGLSAAGNAGIGSNVVQTVKTDTFSTTSSSMVTVTGLTVTITPTSDTSKVLVILSGIIGHSGSNERMQVNLRRDGTNIGLATGGVSGNTMIFYDTGEYNDQYSLVFLDSPATTSAVTYDLQTSTVAGTVQFGRIGVSDRRGINTITAIEVAV
jgi:hypothetical protein